jgi:hypothetical protein
LLEIIDVVRDLHSFSLERMKNVNIKNKLLGAEIEDGMNYIVVDSLPKDKAKATLFTINDFKNRIGHNTENYPTLHMSNTNNYKSEPKMLENHGIQVVDMS